jgi:hypothetical protein
MIQLSANSRILIATAPQDFRKGIDGFVALCRNQLKQNPRQNEAVFVFINRSKTMVRLLSYDHNGYWLMTKRLSKGKYRQWPKNEQAITPLIAKHLRLLLRNDSL